MGWLRGADTVTAGLLLNCKQVIKQVHVVQNRSQDYAGWYVNLQVREIAENQESDNT